MLFRRRQTESLWERMRVHMWPRRSWSRSGRYIVYRLRRLSATPHAIALGFGIGAFAAMTPFIGTHMVMAALLAWAIGGSMVAAVLGTFLGNPVTYPFFWFASYKIGNILLGTHGTKKHIDLTHGIFESSFAKLWPILKPMALGSIPLGLALAAGCYFLVKPMVEAYQHRRRRELLLRQDRDEIGAGGTAP
jgi:uncharacterized protein (DUF2062 family)